MSLDIKTLVDYTKEYSKQSDDNLVRVSYFDDVKRDLPNFFYFIDACIHTDDYPNVVSGMFITSEFYYHELAVELTEEGYNHDMVLDALDDINDFSTFRILSHDMWFDYDSHEVTFNDLISRIKNQWSENSGDFIDDDA